MADAEPKTNSPLAALPIKLFGQPGLLDLTTVVQEKRSATIDGAWGSSAALTVSALSHVAPGTILVVLPREREVDEFTSDLASFGIAKRGMTSKELEILRSTNTNPEGSSADHRTSDESRQLPTEVSHEIPLVLPSWASLPNELSITDPVLGNRLRVIRALESDSPPRIVVTTISALLQPVPSRSQRVVSARTIKVGDELDLDNLVHWMTSRGFERVTAIEVPGEFAIHGGIVDVFPPDSSDPLRIELFGDEIESIRLFDAESQRKIRDLTEATITILEAGQSCSETSTTADTEPSKKSSGSASVKGVQASIPDGDHPLDSLPDSAWVIFMELDQVTREGMQYLDRLSDPRGLFRVEATLERCARRGWINLAPIVAGGAGDAVCHLKVQSIERFSGARAEAFSELERVVAKDETVIIACHNEAGRIRLTELLQEVYAPSAPSEIQATNQGSGDTNKPTEVMDQMAPLGSPLKRFLKKKDDSGSSSTVDTAQKSPTPRKSPSKAKSVPQENTLSLIPASPTELGAAKPLTEASQDPGKSSTPKSFADRVRICVGHVVRGFRLISERLVVISDNELFHRHEVQRTSGKKRFEARAIDSFLDLQPGDLVVHLTHGIARFRGMEVRQKGEITEEMLALDFAEGVKVQVPVSLIHLVQKYVGGTKAAPELSKIGGTAWASKKKKAAEAVSDMAADMLKMQAERDLKPGLTCPPDSHWMQEFDAAFPYTETVDQTKAILETKGDMERPRPMDRLICGDVGFGKTEVAMRAAFKAVDAGRQVAVLVPTTVLCEQHFRSFSERMAEFPVNLASLNRFRTPSEAREVLKGLEDGSIDIVIGTHRLVSKDVKFKNLGLLVIDEEQRFGVEVKELLKHMRLEVDVLTLSATPIPRTLHMSLIGVRDISNLETPPHDRLAVETRIVRWDKELIRSAIVRELNRNGQTYFVHNRIYNIQSIADSLRALVPEAIVDVVHGQMDEDEMESAMLGFVEGRTDILVATTIIESGLDIPNANTIFINQADKYGLSDLHQLRGRVGRYKHRAYCYLLLEDGRQLTPQGSKRLKAIEEYSELGAGFKIAMRDLEIRGAGNILGTEQSGHIAAVGYELYCQLLENAVRAIKREPLREYHHVEVALPVEAYFPSDYIPDGRPKIEMYRRLSTTPDAEALAELKAELRDRFGPMPKPAEWMFEVRELQLLAWRWQIHHIRISEGEIVFGYRSPRLISKLAKFSYATIRILDDREAMLILPPKLSGNKALFRLLKETLQANPG